MMLNASNICSTNQWSLPRFIENPSGYSSYSLAALGAGTKTILFVVTYGRVGTGFSLNSVTVGGVSGSQVARASDYDGTRYKDAQVWLINGVTANTGALLSVSFGATPDVVSSTVYAVDTASPLSTISTTYNDGSGPNTYSMPFGCTSVAAACGYNGSSSPTLQVCDYTGQTSGGTGAGTFQSSRSCVNKLITNPSIQYLHGTTVYLNWVGGYIS